MNTSQTEQTQTEPPTVAFYVRSVYGNQMRYPANETAQRFASLLGVKTLSTKQLAEIGALGFAVRMVFDPATALVGVQS